MSARIYNDNLSITPLGAGDLIDRAVRFYRNNFWTFVLIAAPPILFGTLLSVGWTIIGHTLFDFGKDAVLAQALSNLFTALGNSIILFFEFVAVLVVMGGASRNFVRHILFGEAITFRQTYNNVRSRIIGLTVASTIILFLFSIIGSLIFYLGFAVLAIAILLIVTALSFSKFLATIVSVFLGIAIFFGMGWLFFLAASRFAYVPQVMMVEGQGVFAAIGRSTTLASGNVKRLAALFIFTIFAIYSALLLLYIPLGWYAYINGVTPSFFAADTLPAWYVVTNQVISQLSFILLMPVWMVGLCLLYVDERVRHEGYDIELLAARNLGDIPALPQNYTNPLQPALANQTIPNPPPSQSAQNSSITTLGLN